MDDEKITDIPIYTFFNTEYILLDDYIKELESLKRRIKNLEKYNKRLELDCQKWFDKLMECEYRRKNE